MRLCSTCGAQWADDLERCPRDGGALVAATAATTVLQSTGTGDAVAAPVLDDELPPGTQVGEYVIEKLIGEGGMGAVYGARHPVIGKRAAIKVLHARLSADREGIARFVQEAQAVNKIGHANIIDIFAFGVLPDRRAYFVMEWLQGETLDARIARGTVPIAEGVTILLALVRALEAAHGAGVIHRDLKPENVFLLAEDDGVRVKLLDFGIAKLSSGGMPASKTATGTTVGTPLYMSPEQARGEELDGRTDLYSLGVVGFEILTGTTPFAAAGSPIEVMHAHIATPPRPPRELRPDAPPALDELILALLAKKADDRPTLAEVKQRLGRLAGRAESAPIAVETVATAAADDDQPARHHSRAPAIAGVLAAGLVGAVAWLAFAHHPSPASPPAPPGTSSPSAPPALSPPPAPPPPSSPPAPSAQPAAPPAAPPAPASSTSHLDLSLDPATASLTIDGVAVPVAHGRASAELAPGPHRLAARAPGYRALDRRVVATAGTHDTLALHLDRIAPHAHAAAATATDTDAVIDPFHRTKAP